MAYKNLALELFGLEAALDAILAGTGNKRSEQILAGSYWLIRLAWRPVRLRC